MGDRNGIYTLWVLRELTMKRINWQKKCREAEGLLKIARDGNKLLNAELEAWKDSTGFWRDASNSHKCPKSKWYWDVNETFAIAGILVIGYFLAMLFFTSMWKIPEFPRETIRYVVKNDPALVAHDKACTEWYLRKERYADN